MKALYYGVKNLDNGKIENMGCNSKWHDATKKANDRLTELQKVDNNGNYKIITFIGRI